MSLYSRKTTRRYIVYGRNIEGGGSQRVPMTEITRKLFSVVMDGGYQILQPFLYRCSILEDKAHKLLDYILIGALLFFYCWNDHFPCNVRTSKKALSLNNVRLQGSVLLKGYCLTFFTPVIGT